MNTCVKTNRLLQQTFVITITGLCVNFTDD